MGRLRSGEHGAALLELALVLPMLLFLALAVWEFGRVFDARLVVDNAAREGARYASLGRTDTEVRERVANYLDDALATRLLAQGDVTFRPADVQVTGARGTVGDPVSVGVPITVRFAVPTLINMPSNIRLSGQATMRLECGGTDPC